MFVEFIDFFDISEEEESCYVCYYLIDWWNQEKLKEVRVLVVGCGVLGNEVLKNLVFVGVGKIIVIDFDIVLIINLICLVLF